MRRKEQGVVKISNLFDVYKKRFTAPQKTVVTTLQEIVKDLYNIDIKKDQCSYTVATKTVYLTMSGMVKTELLFKKEEILTHLKGRLGEKSAPKQIL